MGANGQVNITVADSGAAAAQVPGSKTILVMGPSSSGTPTQIVATQNPNTVLSNYGYGPMSELAAMLAQAGATVLAMKTPTNTPGSQKPVQFIGSGTSVITTTGTAWDDYFVKFVVVNPGTIGTAGITFQLSLDAGRNFGPTLTLGTANTYAIPNTGITLAFAAGTLVANDAAQFQCIAPTSTDAAYQACLTAFQASQYAVAGVGNQIASGPMSGADASTLETYLDALADGFVYNRLMINARDAAAPQAWTGSSSESESVWMAALALDYSAVSARRICASAGFYNMPSPFANPAAGSPRYRRPLSWALACRQVLIPPQRHAGEVRDGALPQIVLDPTNDPRDGFVYHDERMTPGLDDARFTSALTRVGKPGVFIRNPNLMSPPGSQFTLLPLGLVMDIACDVVNQVGQDELGADVRLNNNGTIFEAEAESVEDSFDEQLAAQVVNPFMVSSASAVIDRSWNVEDTNKVKVTVSMGPRGYVLEVDATIQFIQLGQGS